MILKLLVKSISEVYQQIMKDITFITKEKLIVGVPNQEHIQLI